MVPVCVFDVNETLLDLAALDGAVRTAVRRAGVRQAWFGQLLQSAMVSTVTGAYRDFGTIGRAALDMTADRFEAVLSADAVRRLKPAPEPYRMAAERLGVEPGDVLLVAAHAWDIAGALRAGGQAAFVARPGKVLDPLVDPPELVVADLDELADRLLAGTG